MTTPRHLEQDLPVLIADMYLAGTPDYRDDIVRRTARVRQRPAWTFPERWLPMDVVTRSVPTPAFPWRQLGVLALIGLLLAAVLAAYIGSQPRPPAPFGPAANGVVIYSVAGDIYTADPLTGSVEPLVTGPETDVRPRFSFDGTMVAFERKVDADGLSGEVYVVRADGSGLTRVTTEPVRLTPSVLGETWESYEFSPDGRSLLIAAGTGILIAQADGSGVRRIDLGRLAASGAGAFEPSFRPPDGAEILFVGNDNIVANGGAGLYAVDPTSGLVRTIVEPSQGGDLAGASWSPDGSRIAYWSWVDDPNSITARTHIVLADGTGDRTLPAPPGAVWDGGSAWSNDGTRLLIIRGNSPFYEDTHAAIVPADGSGTGVEIDSGGGSITAECCSSWEWSPDDSMLLGTPVDSSGQPLQQVIVDAVTGALSRAPWTSIDDPAWQRVAP